MSETTNVEELAERYAAQCAECAMTTSALAAVFRQFAAEVRQESAPPTRANQGNRLVGRKPPPRPARPVQIKHGTVYSYDRHGCRCGECRDARIAKDEKRKDRLHAETVTSANNHGKLWTGAELEIIVTRTDLTFSELAKMLGRTRKAVASAHIRATTEPKWIAMVGAGAAVERQEP